jgi:hypothetical protein
MVNEKQNGFFGFLFKRQPNQDYFYKMKFVYKIFDKFCNQIIKAKDIITAG